MSFNIPYWIIVLFYAPVFLYGLIVLIAPRKSWFPFVVIAFAFVGSTLLTIAIDDFEAAKLLVSMVLSFLSVGFVLHAIAYKYRKVFEAKYGLHVFRAIDYVIYLSAASIIFYFAFRSSAESFSTSALTFASLKLELSCTLFLINLRLMQCALQLFPDWGEPS